MPSLSVKRKFNFQASDCTPPPFTDEGEGRAPASALAMAMTLAVALAMAIALALALALALGYGFGARGCRGAPGSGLARTGGEGSGLGP